MNNLARNDRILVLCFNANWPVLCDGLESNHLVNASENLQIFILPFVRMHFLSLDLKRFSRVLLLTASCVQQRIGSFSIPFLELESFIRTSVSSRFTFGFYGNNCLNFVTHFSMVDHLRTKTSRYSHKTGLTSRH